MADSKKDKTKEKSKKRNLRFNLLDDIKLSKYYGKRGERSAKARTEINENIKTSSKSRVVPG